MRLTGSRAYGSPRPDSDWDFVVLVDERTGKILADQGEDGSRWGDGYGMASGRARFGNIDLVLITHPLEYQAWVKATEALEEEKPVTKEQAKLTIDIFVKQATTQGRI